MPVFKITAPDGTVYKVTGPEGSTEAQALEQVKAQHAAKAPVTADKPKQSMPVGMQTMTNIGGGILRGAGSIGATILAPIDAAARAIGVQNDFIGRTDRRDAMDNALQGAGVETDSLAYAGGKLGAEIAGTLGAGGAIANAAARVPGVAAAAPNLLQSIRTAGMSSGTGGVMQNALLRAAGGATSGAASAGLVNPSDVAQGGVIGAVAPNAIKVAGAVGGGIGKVARKVLPQASDEVAALAKRAAELGIDVPADRLVDSKPLNAVAASLNYVPLSGRAGTEAKMAKQLDRALSRTFGQDSENVTQALRKASSALGGQFDTVLQNNSVKITPAFKQALAEAEDRATNELGAEGAGIIHKQIAAILSKGTTGEIDGQAAYNIKKTLDRIGARNTSEAFYARDLKKALMAALNESLGPQQAASFKTLRQQYGNMLALENLAQNGAEGGVSAARLGNMKNIGNDDLQELADIASQFMRTRESPHGALQRLVIGGTAASVGGGLGALPAVAGAAVAGRGANAALNSNAMRRLITNDQTPNALARLLQQNPELLQAGVRAAPVALGDR
jgi:hypothetical protein